MCVTNEFLINLLVFSSIFVLNRFKQLYNYTSYGIPTKHGDKYFVAIREPEQNQAIIYSLNSLKDEPNIFLNPNDLSSDGTIALKFTAFSRNGKYCAYGISKGGSDWTTVRVKNVDTLNDLEDDVLNKIKFSNIAWTINNDGFFYAVSLF